LYKKFVCTVGCRLEGLFIGCLAHDEEKKEVEERRVAVKKEKGTAQCEKGHLLHYVLLAAYSYMQCSSEGGGGRHVH
jgi:hypothetical protein